VERETHRKGPPEQTARPQQQQPSLLAMREPSPRSRAPGANGAPGAAPQPSGQDVETESLPQPGREGAPGGPPSRPSPPQAMALLPSPQTLQRALGSAGTSDYLADVDEGE